jgi:predicted 3-demethylubiquinone-9 3-methyltransferase (glyoxalase superfamily)
MSKNTICVWYDRDAKEAANFYAATFPDSHVGAVHRAPSDSPGGTAGDVMVVEFTVCGIPCIGLNGGSIFPHSECFSFWQITPQVLTDAIAQGGDVAKRAFDAMAQMVKIDVAAIEAAVKG